MRYMILLSFLLLFGCSPQPPKPLFVVVKDPELNQTQQKVLDSLKAEAWIVNPVVVTIQKLEGQSFLLPLPEESIEIKGFKQYADGSVSWRNTEDTEFGLLTIKDGKCNGLFYSGKKIYAIQHMGGDLHVLSQVDQTKFPKPPPKKK